MTEAGERWALENGSLAHSDPEEAEFWIKAFVAEVKNRARPRCGKCTQPDSLPCTECLGEAFLKLIGEFLGDSHAD